MGALGAALFALDHVLAGRAPATRGRPHEFCYRNRRRVHLYQGGDSEREPRHPGRAMRNTGFKLAEVSRQVYQSALENAGLRIRHFLRRGHGVRTSHGGVQRYEVTDLTASARGATFFFPKTRTILDVGGQTMKASRIDESPRSGLSVSMTSVPPERALSWKRQPAIWVTGRLRSVPSSRRPNGQVAISGVCAVFAESEVINQLSLGTAPADIMHGAMVSLVDRSVQFMKRVRMEPEFTLVGGILRFGPMAQVVREHLKAEVNVPPGNLVQFVGALGAAILALRRLQKLNAPAGKTAALAPMVRAYN